MSCEVEITVGEGRQFQKIGEALEFAANYVEDQVTIRIFPGTYYEKLEIRQRNLTLEGEDAESTIITYDDYANNVLPNGEKVGTFRSYTMLVVAPGVRLRKLTIENSAGTIEGSGQCVALYAEGEDIVVRNCRLVSGQDTLFTGPLPPKEVLKNGFRGPTEFAPRVNGRQYYFDCYICGTTDFIFGSATAYFENCTIDSLPGSNYVTAASTPEGQKYGYIFTRCRFIGEVPEQSVYLGRPWREYARTIIMYSYLGAHIRPEGWHDWEKELNQETAFYAEYENYGPGAEGQRVSWAHYLTEEEASECSLDNIGFPGDIQRTLS